MKPPYHITGKILKLVASVSEKIGEVNAAHLNKPPTGLTCTRPLSKVITLPEKNI